MWDGIKGYVKDVMCTSHLLDLHRMKLQGLFSVGTVMQNGAKECSGSFVLEMRG